MRTELRKTVKMMMSMTILFLMTGCREQQVTQTWEQAHEQAHEWDGQQVTSAWVSEKGMK